jgi:hypothetical protein
MIRSGCNVLYHNFVHFGAKIHINGMVEDCTTKESFKVVVMFYTATFSVWSECSYQ